MCHNRQLRHSLKQQQGGALAIAVFVIVAMSLLAIAMNRTISASSSQTVHEVLGTRALLAGESGNEVTLNQIFPLATVAVPNPAKQSCPNPNTIRFTNNGLNNCVVTTVCRSEPAAVDQNQDAFYFVESVGVCKAKMIGDTSDFECRSTDEICVSRRVEVEAKAL